MYDVRLFVESLRFFQLFNKVLRINAKILVVMVTCYCPLVSCVALKVGVMGFALEIQRKYCNVVITERETRKDVKQFQRNPPKNSMSRAKAKPLKFPSIGMKNTVRPTGPFFGMFKPCEMIS